MATQVPCACCCCAAMVVMVVLSCMQHRNRQVAERVSRDLPAGTGGVRRHQHGEQQQRVYTLPVSPMRTTSPPQEPRDRSRRRRRAPGGRTPLTLTDLRLHPYKWPKAMSHQEPGAVVEVASHVRYVTLLSHTYTHILSVLNLRHCCCCTNTVCPSRWLPTPQSAPASCLGHPARSQP